MFTAREEKKKEWENKMTLKEIHCLKWRQNVHPWVVSANVQVSVSSSFPMIASTSLQSSLLITSNVTEPEFSSEKRLATSPPD